MAPEAVERKCVLVSGEKYSYKAPQEAMEQLLEVGEPSTPRLFRLIVSYPCTQTHGESGRRRQHPLQVSFSGFQLREIFGGGRDE